MLLNNLKKIHRNNNGFSITETLVVVGIGTILLYSIMTLVNWQQKTEKTNSAKLEFAASVAELAKSLSNQSSCSMILADVIGKSTYYFPPGTTKTLSLYSNSAGGAKFAEVGKQFSGPLFYTQVSLQTSNSIGTSGMVPAQLNLEVADSSGANVQNQTINILLNTDSGSYSGCYADENDESACISMGGVWNVSSVPKCMLSGKVLCESMNRIWDATTSTCKPKPPAACDSAFYATATKTPMATLTTFNTNLGHPWRRRDTDQFTPAKSGCYVFTHLATSNVGYCYIGNSIGITDQSSGTIVYSGRGAPLCPCQTSWHMPWRCTGAMQNYKIFVNLNAGVTYNIERVWIGRGYVWGGTCACSCAGVNYSGFNIQSSLSVELAE